MKLFRYRKPSLNNILGVTRVKRSIRKATGISTINRYTNPSRIKQTLKQDIGIYNNPVMTIARQSSKGKLPTIFGFFNKK
jgi:hypothetical protein